MRVSTDPKDPGFVGRESAAIYRVFLDGEELFKVLSADDEAGEVVVYVMNPDGRMAMNPTRPGRAMTEVRRGRVLIVPSPAPVE